MLQPMTREEYERIMRKAVENARRNPPLIPRIAPPIDLQRLRAIERSPFYEGFEEDINRMRQGLQPLGPRE